MAQFFQFPPVMMPLRQYPLAQAMAINPATLQPGTPVRITDFGGTIAITDGVRWRLERLYLAWGGLPSALLVPVGTEASITDCGGAIAVAGVAGWVFRPVEIFNSGAVVQNSTIGSEVTAYSATIPAGLMGTKGTCVVESFVAAQAANSNAKSAVVRFGGTAFNTFSLTASYRVSSILTRIRNTGISANRGLEPAGGLSPGTSSFQLSAITAIDTSVAVPVTLGSTVSVSGDVLTFSGCTVTIKPAM